MRKLKTISKIIMLGLTGLLIGPLAHSAEVISPNTKSSSCLNVRLKPNGPILGCVKRNETMLGFQQSGNWLKVRYNGREGYVYNRGGKYVRTKTAVPKPTFQKAAPAAQPKPVVQKSPESPGFFVPAKKIREAAPAVAEKPAQEPVASRTAATAAATVPAIPAPTRRPAPPTLDGVDVQNTGAIPAPRSSSRPTLDGMEIERTGNVPTPNAASRPTLDGVQVKASGHVPTPNFSERTQASTTPAEPESAAATTEAEPTPLASFPDGPDNSVAAVQAAVTPEVAPEVVPETSSPKLITNDKRIGTSMTPMVNSCLKLRDSASLEAKELDCMPASSQLKVTAATDKFLKVETPDGKEGWVAADYMGTRLPGQGAEYWRKTGCSGNFSCKMNETNPVACLTCNLYFEARGENAEGRKAVNYTVFNRTQNPKRWSSNICKNVMSREFSWTFDNKPNTVPCSAFKRRQEEAIDHMNDYLSGKLDSDNIGLCANHYANVKNSGWRAVRGWIRTLTNQKGSTNTSDGEVVKVGKIGKVGGHTFYNERGRACFNGSGPEWERLAREAGMLPSQREIASADKRAKKTFSSTDQEGID